MSGGGGTRWSGQTQPVPGLTRYYCSICKTDHLFRLPLEHDFHIPQNNHSTRISSVKSPVDGFWHFTNFRKEVFLRSVGDSPKWYFRPKNCPPYQLHYEYHDVIERFYGRFLQPSSTDEEKQFLLGYTHVTAPDGSVEIFFNEALYNSGVLFQNLVDETCNPRSSSPNLKSLEGNFQYKEQESNQSLSENSLFSIQKNATGIDLALNVDSKASRTFNQKTPSVHQSFSRSEGVTRANDLQVPHYPNASRIFKHENEGHISNNGKNGGNSNRSDFTSLPSSLGNGFSLLNQHPTKYLLSIFKTDFDKQTTKTNPENPVQNWFNLGINSANYHSINNQYTSSSSKEEQPHQTTPLSDVCSLKLSPEENNLDILDSCEEVTEKSLLNNKNFKTVTITQTYQPDDPWNKYSVSPNTVNKYLYNIGNPEGTKNWFQKLLDPFQFFCCGCPDLVFQRGFQDANACNERFTDQNSKLLKVFSVLQSKYQETYRKESWKKHFPIKYEFQRTPLSVLYEWTVMFQQNGFVKQDDKIFSSTSNMPQDILIMGLAGFGKTTFCSMLAYHWAMRFTEMKDFELCIFCRLPELVYNSDLNSFIISLCEFVLADRNTNRKTVEEALRKYSSKIVLLLDGYDQLSEKSQKDVLYFLKSRTVFRTSTIVITSRPSSNAALQKRFHRRVYIEGFCANYMKKLLRSIEVPDCSIRYFLYKIRKHKLDYLQGLSPFFTLTAAKVVRKNYQKLDIFNNLYVLLDLVIDNVVADQMEMKQSVYHKSDQFQLLGRMCFEKLVSGDENFREREVVGAFGKQLDFLVECNIFHKVSEIKQKDGVWRVSGRVLMVFFATMYLRASWLAAKDRDKFLEEEFCCNGCTGDYVVFESNLKQPCLYYVGIIPEIALKCTKRSWEDSTFEMYYDLERIEHSQAFSAVSVLSRISDKFLRRFGFRALKKDDKSSEEIFSSVLNSISVDNCSVDYLFYNNVYEEKYFMKIVVTDPGDNCTILRCTLRSDCNGTIDGMFIDFAFCKFDDLFPFINYVLSRYLKRGVMYDNIKNSDLDDFVFQLVMQLFESDLRNPVIVSCTSNKHKINETCKNSCMFQFDPGLNIKGEKSVCVSRPFFERNPTTFDKYQFLRDRYYVKHVLDAYKSSPDVKISINVL